MGCPRRPVIVIALVVVLLGPEAAWLEYRRHTPTKDVTSRAINETHAQESSSPGGEHPYRPFAAEREVICRYRGNPNFKKALCDSAKTILADYSTRFAIDVNDYVAGDPIPLEVTSCATAAYGGLTSFSFSGNRVSCDKVTLQANTCATSIAALRHELCHYVVQHYLESPVPRWADEGLATVQESRVEIERVSSFGCTPETVNLKELMGAEEYPQELWHFYGQSTLLVRYLLKVMAKQKTGDRLTPEARFLRFLRAYRDEHAHALHVYFPEFADLEVLESYFQRYVHAECARYSPKP